MRAYLVGAERVPWLRLWLRDLERGVFGRWDRDLSLAIDAARVQIEGFAP